MKAKNILTLSMICVISTTYNIAYADLVDSTKEMTKNVTNTAKNITGDLVGDWCSGQKYLFIDMNLSERLKDGSGDLQKEIEKLNDTASKMDFDIKTALEGEVGKTINNAKNLVKMNDDLCIKAKSANYTSVDYNGATLRDKNEVKAQIRLNLATIRTNNKVMEAFNSQESEFNELNSRIKEKANELAVLKKNFDALADPRSENKDSSYVDSVIGNACTAIIEGEDLIMSYTNKNAAGLFRNAARDNQTKTISESEVVSFMEGCSGKLQWL